VDADRAARRLADLDDATTATLRPAVEGHPDLVLARAVRDRGLSNDEASLISRARLDGIGTRHLANEQGLSPYQYRRKLARAENRLMRFLADSPPRPAA
jgi:hypothetical protein